MFKGLLSTIMMAHASHMPLVVLTGDCVGVWGTTYPSVFSLTVWRANYISVKSLTSEHNQAG